MSGRTLGMKAQSITVDVRPLQQADRGNERLVGFTSPPGLGLIRFRLHPGGTLEVCVEVIEGAVVVPSPAGSPAAEGQAAGKDPGGGDKGSGQ
jgi:hypothetical protein